MNFAIRAFCPVSFTLTPALIDTLRGRASGKGYALASGAGGMRIVFGTFSVSHRPVGQVIFARRLARTYAVSGKSAMQCAGINRHEARNERVLRERSSEPLGPEFCVEGRPLIKENIHQSSTRPTQSGACVSQGLAGVRKVAREHKEMKFTALLHHVTVDLLRDSFGSLKRKAAPGVDGVTWQDHWDGRWDIGTSVLLNHQ